MRKRGILAPSLDRILRYVVAEDEEVQPRFSRNLLR